MGDAARKISQGCLSAIFTDAQTASNKFPVPVLQCLQIKPLAPPTGGAAGSDRYRVVMSDMVNYVQCMLATQANHVVHEGKLQRGSILRVKAYQSNNIKGKNILILLEVEVMEELGTPEKIGEPVAFEPGNAPAAATSTTIGGTGFYGVKSEDSKSQVQKQIRHQDGGGSAGPPSGTIYPIEGLSPYAHKWTIKARVSQKSDIKTWHKASGEGKLFSVNLLDESGEIKATGFNEQCDQYYDLFQEGQVYYISNPCKVSLAKKQFSNLPNDYELIFERDTVIEKAEDQTSVPQVRFNFTNIHELQGVDKDSTVDCIGILKEAAEITSIVSKTTQKPYDKRELTLVDDSGYSVRCTVWGKIATNFDANPESVIAFKGLRVSDFGGKSLSLLSSGTMSVDPDIPEAHRLKGWYDSTGRGDNFATHSGLASMGSATGRQDQVKVIQAVKDEQLGMEEQAYFSLKATIVYIKQDSFCYPACRSADCNKKVTDMGDGTWRCEKCDINHDKPEYRYVMSVNVNDHTGQLWLSCFDEVGRVIMGGKTADELMAMKEEDEAALTAAWDAANCTKLSFRCRAKMDTFGEAQRVRYQVMSASPIDFKGDALKFSELIKQMEQM